MKPKSNTLFHFTSNVAVLTSILKGGSFWPRYCLEDVSWLGYDSEYVAYPMVCFCDIPLSRITEHVQFYGEYGIGMTREWAERSGLNPVLYVSPKNNLINSFRDLNAHLRKVKVEDGEPDSRVPLRFVFAFSKPTIGNMIRGGNTIEVKFYQESEWRYVPQAPQAVLNPFLKKDQFENAALLEHCNQDTKTNCSLPFSPSDVRYIFVKTDDDIPGLVTFIDSQLGHLAGNDQKKLMSKIVSLESLREDL